MFPRRYSARLLVRTLSIPFFFCRSLLSRVGELFVHTQVLVFVHLCTCSHVHLLEDFPLPLYLSTTVDSSLLNLIRFVPFFLLLTDLTAWYTPSYLSSQVVRPGTAPFLIPSKSGVLV